MARAIVRLSLEKDYGSQVTNAVRERLEGAGFTRLSTGSYEIAAASLPSVVQALKDSLDELVGMAGNRALDHIWIYVDESS